MNDFPIEQKEKESVLFHTMKIKSNWMAYVLYSFKLFKKIDNLNKLK